MTSAPNPPAVTPRPPGVFWARSGPGRSARLCEDAEHPIYVRRISRPKRGDPATLEGVDVYACATCWPPGGPGSSGGGKG